MKSPIAQKGGVKLKDTKKLGFKPVFDMLQSPNCVLDLLTYKSFKGFMFTLNIPPEETEYIARGKTSNRFDDPVTSFIMKIVITAPGEYHLPPFKNHSKSAETKESFYEEAKLQQHIWLKSIQGKRPEICPSVANLALFNGFQSHEFLIFLSSKTQGIAQDAVQYLHNIVLDRNYEIGVMLMPNITESLTFNAFLNIKGQFVYGIPVDRQRIEFAYAYLISQVCRLYVDIGVIHFDLHRQNCLIRIHNGEITALIIDFGRASNFMNDVPDEYLSVDQKMDLQQSRKDAYENLFSLPYTTENNFQDQASYVEGMMLYIKFLDAHVNKQMFANYTGYQMRWLEKVLQDGNSIYFFANAFDILKRNTETNVIQTFGDLQRKGYIENYDDMDVDDVTVPFNESITCTTDKVIDAAKDICVVMGGKKTVNSRTSRKRKSKRERKQNKSKQQRKGKRKIQSKSKSKSRKQYAK